MSPGPALVVLAAGASERLGEPKALARLGPGDPGTPLGLLLAAGAWLGDGQPLVVAGRDFARIAAAVHAGVEVLENPDWRAGRTGSVQCAARHRPGRDLCLAPVDVPLVPGEVFRALAAAWEQRGSPARGWLAPRVLCGGERRHGHPVLIGRELFTPLKDFPPDRPLHVLRALADPLFAVDVASDAILEDLDSPADLERLAGRLAARPIGG